METDSASGYHDIQIGDLTIRGNLVLAPLAGFTDRPFRTLCRSHGASLTWSEMVSAEAAARGSRKTNELMRRADGEAQLVIQLFLSHYTQALRALPAVLKHRPSLIDINCGCPVPKVVKTGAGSALMKHPETMADIVKALCGHTDIPVSVKFRSGWDSDSITYRFFAQTAQEAGASLLALHPRTRSQGYSGTADWSQLALLSPETDVPLLGSGDADTPRRVREMLVQTGVDGVMIGRGAVGNPFLFTRSVALLTEGTDPGPPDSRRLFGTIMEHLDMHIAETGEQQACREMRKQVCAYTKGLPGSAQLRGAVVHAASRSDYEHLLQFLLR